MLRSLRKTWSREAIGYRQGELDDGDAVAAMVVTLIGGPAVVVGAALLTSGNLDLGQILLVAPVGALFGALLVGSAAAMAAQTGASGSWLLRPAFGRGGSMFVSMVRLAMVVLWAVVALQVGGEWAAGSLQRLGVAAPAEAGVGIVAALGLLLVLLGLVRTVKRIVRKPLFILSVVLVAAAAWQLLGASLETAGGGGPFWVGVQLAVEAAVVFFPFVESVARRLHDDEVAMTAFAVGYAVPATLMLGAGAFLAATLGGVGEVGRIGAGTAGVAVMVAWVVVAEADQAFSAFVAAGSEAIGIVRVGAAWVIGLAVSGGVVALAVLVPGLPLAVASLASAVVLPAAVISVADFHFARDHHYTEADIYGRTEDFLNVPGVACWLVAVAIGQLLQPAGPAWWAERVPVTAVTGSELPWRLITAAVIGVIYVAVQRWGSSRKAAVYGVGRVGMYGSRPEG